MRDYYTEIIAEKLIACDIAQKLQSIKEINRKKYNVKHDGQINYYTNREEEIFAKRLKGKTLNIIGKIIDYQIPLKADKFDKKVGKIDLISYTEEGSKPVCYLIELKHLKNNKDTLLRCILEITTYYQLLNKQNFINSYKRYFNNPLKLENIKKSILVFEGSSQHDEIIDLQEGHRPYLRMLLKKLDINIFLYGISCINL